MPEISIFMDFYDFFCHLNVFIKIHEYANKESFAKKVVTKTDVFDGFLQSGALAICFHFISTAYQRHAYKTYLAYQWRMRYVCYALCEYHSCFGYWWRPI